MVVEKGIQSKKPSFSPCLAFELRSSMASLGKDENLCQGNSRRGRDIPQALVALGSANTVN